MREETRTGYVVERGLFRLAPRFVHRVPIASHMPFVFLCLRLLSSRSDCPLLRVVWALTPFR